MITLKKALEEVSKRYKVGKVREYRDFWVFDFEEEVESRPIAVYKKTGEMFLFFPPYFLGKDIGEEKVIEVSSILSEGDLR